MPAFLLSQFKDSGGATMMRVTFLGVILGFLFAVLPVDGHAFRCGSGLVIEGDSSAKVLIECGSPTYKESVGTKTDGKAPSHRDGKAQRASKTATRKNKEKVERWTYNCGEHDLVYVLTFEGGVLTKEETQGYGNGRSDCQGKR
jgi:hypothetical protein